ncbi:MAG: ROK family protein, partial [Acidimicrobiales bacterium]
ATLSVDVGGSHIKASVLDADATMTAEPVRVATPYPLTPQGLVDALAGLARQLPPFDQVSVGFPGMVRKGHVLSAPHFVTAGGPGSEERPDLVRAWHQVDLASALAEELGRPTKVDNDADQQGAAVVLGDGLELVVTLGTGMGTAFFQDGALLPHLELAHHPFRKGQTYDEQLGDLTRRVVGNAKHLTIDLGPEATIVDNTSGILGGARLWQGAGHRHPQSPSSPGSPAGTPAGSQPPSRVLT